MRVFLISTVLLCQLLVRVDGAGLPVSADLTARAAYREWLEKYGADQHSEQNVLQGQSSDGERYKQFKNTYAFIKEKEREGPRGFEMELNKFATLSEPELAQMTGRNLTELVKESLKEGTLKYEPLTSSTSPIVHSVDHRIKTGLSQARSVDFYVCSGSNWAFAAVDALESRYKLLTDEIPLFSEQEFMDCAYQDTGKDTCDGGYMGKAYEYLERYQRIGDRRDYRYSANYFSCQKDTHKNAMSRAEVEAYSVLVPGEDNLRREVSTHGPVATLIHAPRSMFYYKSGLYDTSECSPDDDVNHAVTVVGYKPDRWIIKNVWGPDWGNMNGYAYLSRRYTSDCKISNFAVTITLKKSANADDVCVHVPEPDRQPCWEVSSYTTTRSRCERQGCCWDPNGELHKCFVKGKITLYSGRNFEGASATFYGSIPDLKLYDFHTIAHSIKIHYGKFMVYSNVNYGRTGASWENLSLGVLSAGEYDDLDVYSMSHNIQSIKVLPQGKDVLTLFMHTHARGDSLTIYLSENWLGSNWNDRVSSVFATGQWELCKNANYRGGCATMGGGLNGNLENYNDEVSSVRVKRD